MSSPAKHSSPPTLANFEEAKARRWVEEIREDQACAISLLARMNRLVEQLFDEGLISEEEVHQFNKEGCWALAHAARLKVTRLEEMVAKARESTS